MRGRVMYYSAFYEVVGAGETEELNKGTRMSHSVPASMPLTFCPSERSVNEIKIL